MGSWDIGPFDNDDAADWLYDLEKSSGTKAIGAALRAITDPDEDYLEAPDCANALAAAEIVAALHGQPIARMPDNAEAWIALHHDLDISSLIPLAQKAVQRIRADSELKELWNESGEASKWYATLDDLSTRLDA